jgi:aspartate aminotransferase
MLRSKLPHVGTTIFTVMTNRARELGAVNLSQGFPDYDPPEELKALVDHHVAAGHNQYAPMIGVAELREQIEKKHGASQGRSFDPETQITITLGATEGIFSGVLALVHPGDEVILFDPSYDSYAPAVLLAGGKPIHIPLLPPSFRIDWDRVRASITGRTRLVMINTPHNPTGSVLSQDDIRRLAELAVEHDLVVLADEIYGRLQYEGELLSIATLPGMAERTITLDGFSKTFAMTGWRLGYGIIPEWLVPHFSRLVINSVSCTSAFAQHGAIEALTGPQDAAEAMRTEFIARRQLMVDGLNAIPGVTCVMPHGAFYTFPNISSFGRTSSEIADHLLYDGGVCGLSGTAFGKHGEGYLRFSYANSRENLTEALDRVGESLDKLARTGEPVAGSSPR